MSPDTIVAIATPPGRGGVGIVRLSGPLACFIASQLTTHQNIVPRTVYYTSFVVPSRLTTSQIELSFDKPGDLIDQGVLLYFKAPHSFTGEDVIEFQGHGAPFVLDRLVSFCVLLGARLAKPGEFSERAFLNDKMDLTQAEAVADLIHAHSDTAARMAMRSLQGDFSKKIHEINQHIIQLRLYVEAAIDFPEEEIDFLNDGNISSKLAHILQQLKALRANASQGALLREGLSVVIAGPPNAGKSTLINCLAERDVAIVTDVAGTTRDVMREHILLDDIPLHVVDTAGLRDSDDVVELEGIKRAWQEISRADCLLMVLDVDEQENKQHVLQQDLQNALPSQVPMIKVFNKIDKKGLKARAHDRTVYLSAQSGEGLALLKAKIKEIVGYQSTEGLFLARRRHVEALINAEHLIKSGQDQLLVHRAGELLAEDLRLAQISLCEIIGEFTSDDLLGEIFSSFCIGK